MQRVTPSVAKPGTHLETCSCTPPPLSDSAIDQLATPAQEVRKTGFRNVHVSVEMMEAFLRVAKKNTMNEIETCAILAGFSPPIHSKTFIYSLICLRRIESRFERARGEPPLGPTAEGHARSS